MAGSGYKLFNNGETLEGAEVRNYLMEQSVMRFANATARNAALTSVLAEGMVCYLVDTDTLYVYTGSSWVALATSADIAAITSRDALIKFYMEVI